jgi:cytochrome oxidase Cu insertion factor (SCO1/SenC/PrrC family)
MLTVLRVAIVSVGLSLTLFAPAKAGAGEIDFALTNHQGETFHLHDLRGKVVLVFFGYTLCPDVCPIELQHMSTALKRLGDDSEKARGLFVTVDPEHDSPEVLGQYLNYFDARLVGLTGTRQQIDDVAKKFRVIYQKNPRSDSQYTMDHTANLFVIDQAGKLNTIVPFGFPAEHIETLLRELIATAN